MEENAKFLWPVKLWHGLETFVKGCTQLEAFTAEYDVGTARASYLIFRSGARNMSYNGSASDGKSQRYVFQTMLITFRSFKKSAPYLGMFMNSATSIVSLKPVNNDNTCFQLALYKLSLLTTCLFLVFKQPVSLSHIKWDGSHRYGHALVR